MIIPTDDIQSVLATSAIGIADTIIRYPGPVFIFTSIVLGAITAYVVTRLTGGKIDGNAEMKRRAYLDQMYADDFGDVLFNRLMNGDITRHEYRRDCRRFGIAYRLGDLLVRKNPKRGMKYRVTKNCADMHKTPSVARNGLGPHPSTDPIYSQSKPAVLIVAKRKAWLVPGKVTLHLKSAK